MYVMASLVLLHFMLEWHDLLVVPRVRVMNQHIEAGEVTTVQARQLDPCVQWLV